MSGWREQIERGSLRLLKSRWFWAALVAVVFIANGIWCARNRVAGDVAWYLYAVQRIAGGAVLYRDIHDINLPIVYLLYLPFAWLSRLTGLPVEGWMYAAIWSVVGATLWAICRMPGLSVAARGLFALSTAFAALTLNRFQLGQRDPVCAFLFAGLLLAVYLRMRDPEADLGWPGWVAVLAAGAGLAMKPHFLLPWLLIIAALAWRVGVRRALLMKECWATFLVSAVTWIVTLTGFPDFLAMVREASRYYSNQNVPVYEFSPLLVPLIVVAFALLGKSGGATRPLILLSSLATIGFAVECVVQRKGFPYHLTPAMFWGAITAGLMLVDRFERGFALWRISLITVATSILLAGYSLWTAGMPPPRFFAPTEVEHFVMDHARGQAVLTLSTDLRTGFPLILEAGATNARADAQLWMMGSIYRDQVAPAEDSSTPVQARYHRREEMSQDEQALFDQVVDIVTRQHPAVILVQTAEEKWGFGRLKFDFLDYFRTDERFREALRLYKPGPSNDQRLVLVRDDVKLAGSGGVAP